MVEYVLAKYVDDAARNEPINVGVVVWDGESALCRFDGEDDDGRLDLRRVRARIPASRTYRSWVRFWRNRVGQDEPDKWVIRTTDDFYLEPGGSILFDADERPLPEVLADLYARLVKPPDPPASRSLQQKSLEAMTQAGIPTSDPERFRKQPEVKLVSDGVSTTDEFSYAFKNGAWHYMQEVSFDASRPRASRSAARSAAFLLEHADVTGRLFALFDGEDLAKHDAPLVKMLERFATPVDVSNTARAARTLGEVAHG